MNVTAAEYHPASHWVSRDRQRVECRLCPYHCVLSPDKIGICRGKQNIGGELFAINYGFTTSLNMDPIEKKPLYHFYPGSQILSIGPNGCNLSCEFCQNWVTSQEPYTTRYIKPGDAVRYAQANGSIGIAYTYSEPLIWFEYVLDTSKAAREAGLKNVLVTNGVIDPEPLRELLPWIDAMNIDIKSMDPAFYKKICRGKLDPVLDTVRTAARSVHVEITNLIIPGLNDDDREFEKLTDFIADINPLIPLHFSRYHPDYKLTAPPTPVATLERAAAIALKKLTYIFIGNVAMAEVNNTNCPACSKPVVERSGYSIYGVKIDNGRCRHCGAETGVVTD